MQNNTKQYITILLVIAVSGAIALPRDAAAQILGTGVTPTIEQPGPQLVSVISTAAHALQNFLKEYGLDGVAKLVGKNLIRQMRARTIQWIKTGQFDTKTPFFTTSFIADPQKIADNAARMFLSELTGVNFCNYNPNVPGILPYNLSLGSELACSFGGDYNEFLNDFDNGGFAGLFALRMSGNTFSSSAIDTDAKKEEAVIRAVAARMREAALGFMGSRDPKTGKIKTPGELIAAKLKNEDLAGLVGMEVNDEINETIAAIIDAMVGKVIEDGLL